MKRCCNAKHRHYYCLIFLINIDLHFPNMWLLRHQRWVFIGHVGFASSRWDNEACFTNFCEFPHNLRQSPCSMLTYFWICCSPFCSVSRLFASSLSWAASSFWCALRFSSAVISFYTRENSNDQNMCPYDRILMLFKPVNSLGFFQ